jgi:hypothetical protein
VPDRYRKPFEQTVAQLDRMILAGIERLGGMIADGDPERLRATAAALSRAIQRVQDVASGIIHGSVAALDQAEIDALMDL